MPLVLVCDIVITVLDAQKLRELQVRHNSSALSRSMFFFSSVAVLTYCQSSKKHLHIDVDPDVSDGVVLGRRLETTIIVTVWLMCSCSSFTWDD